MVFELQYADTKPMKQTITYLCVFPYTDFSEGSFRKELQVPSSSYRTYPLLFLVRPTLPCQSEVVVAECRPTGTSLSGAGKYCM
jgi:hypothetical protein